MKTGLYPPLRQCLGGSPPRGSSRLRVHAMMEKVEFAFVLCYWRRRKNTKRYVHIIESLSLGVQNHACTCCRLLFKSMAPVHTYFSTKVHVGTD